MTDLGWSTNTDWTTAQSSENIDINSGTFELADAIPDSVVYDFETGDVSRWDTVYDLSAVSDRVFAGSFAGFCDTPQTDGTGDGGPNDRQASVIPDGYTGGGQPSQFEFYWQETSGSFGGGIRLFNSNGNPEVGLATNNPQWDITDGNGNTEVFAGDGYDRWVRFTITFDWGSGTFSTDFEDLQTGSTFSDTNRPLINGTDIEQIRIEYYSSGNFVTGSLGSNQKAIEMWFDNISISA
jgi:hypothetical protein